MKIVEDGEKKALVAEENIETEDVLVAVDPYVAVVNVEVKKHSGLLKLEMKQAKDSRNTSGQF